MKRHKKLIYLFTTMVLLGLVLYAFAPHVPATPTEVTNSAELDAYLNRLVASANPPGLSVVIVKEGQVVYNKALGFADGPRRIAASPETVYHWWSMTKIPTAIAILQLEERGRLNLDDEVTQCLPWFEVRDRAGSIPSISIRHLLQHTSGLPDTAPAMIGWAHYEDLAYPQTDVLKKHLVNHGYVFQIVGDSTGNSLQSHINVYAKLPSA